MLRGLRRGRHNEDGFSREERRKIKKHRRRWRDTPNGHKEIRWGKRETGCGRRRMVEIDGGFRMNLNLEALRCHISLRANRCVFANSFERHDHHCACAFLFLHFLDIYNMCVNLENHRFSMSSHSLFPIHQTGQIRKYNKSSGAFVTTRGF